MWTPLKCKIYILISFALQIARANGAEVIATTSSADKAALLTKLGATHVINYKETPAWDEEVLKLVRLQISILRIP